MVPRSPQPKTNASVGVVTLDGMVAALAKAGASPFTPRRAITEMEHRRRASLIRSKNGLGPLLVGSSFPLALPAFIEVEPEVFLALEKANRRDLIAAVENVSREYLARREPRDYLLSVLFASARFLPLLEDDKATVGDTTEREVVS